MTDFTYTAGPASEKHRVLVGKLFDAIVKKHAGRHPKDSEVKKFEVTCAENTGLTFVTIEVGMIDDEGTMASIFCRDNRHLAISKRGGIDLLNAKTKCEKYGFFNAVHALTK